MSEKTVKVPGISCGHCVKTIERELGEMEGIRSVQADPADRTVTVAWDDAVTGWASVRDLLEEINYPPEQ